MCKTIDTQTHEAIVELIKTELDDIYDDKGIERLASLIEGRLGYGQETPKGCLPDITPGERDAREEFDDGMLVLYAGNLRIGRLNAGYTSSDMKGNAKLFCAAPKLAEAVYEFLSNVMEVGMHEDTMYDDAKVMLEVLREAGADI